MVKYKFRLANMSKTAEEKIFEVEIGPEETVRDVKEKLRKKFKILDNLDIHLIGKDDSDS